MAHPTMFADDDALLARVRQIALTFPEAKERVSHGSPNWFHRKTFASWRAHIKGEHDSTRLNRALCFLPDEQERAALLEDDRFHVPAYIGHAGWLVLDLAHHLGEPGRTQLRADDPDGVDWDEVGELIDMSYRNTAPKKLVALLDAR